MDFIGNESVFQKFNNAINEQKLIFIIGATGFGKTRFIEEALKDKEYDYISLRNNIDSISATNEIVVIDDFQFIIDKEYLIEDIISLSFKCRNLIILSRSNPSKYFMDSIVSKGLEEIKEFDLAFDRASMLKLFDELLDEKSINELLTISKGNPLGILYVKGLLESGEEFSSRILELSKEAFYDHIKVAVFDLIDQDVLAFLIQISVVDNFTIDMARAITMNDKAKMLTNKAACYGSFINVEKGIYTIRHEMLGALKNKSYLFYSYQEYNEFRNNAGHYFESIGNVVKALELYEKCNNILAIKRVLVHNSTMNPAIGKFKYLRKYYEMLDSEDVKKVPVLLSGMCMLYAIYMDVDKSEYYYNILKEKLSTSMGAELIEIENSLDYLDVALPQRGAKNMFEILANQGRRQNQITQVTPYALTSNCPSIFNGGKDFTEYMNNLLSVVERYGNVMIKSMGAKVGKGLLQTIFAEYSLETGADQLTIMQSVVRARMEIDKTELENSFVVARIEIIAAIETGRLDDAIIIIDNLINDCKLAKEDNLLVNLEAYKAWLYILKDDKSYVEKWISTTPNENIDFISTDRFLYTTKIRCYIFLERYVEAYSLIQKILYYSEKMHRYYLYTETMLLQAVIEYLTNRDYFSTLLEALKMAQERNLIRIVSLFGVTMDEMISVNRDKLIEYGINNDYLVAVNPLLLNMTARYPKLYNKEANLIPELSKTGIMVLQLQSQGHSLKHISERLQMKLETIRYHAKQNYKKLGAAGSTDAVSRAKMIGIL